MSVFLMEFLYRISGIVICKLNFFAYCLKTIYATSKATVFLLYINSSPGRNLLLVHWAEEHLMTLQMDIKTSTNGWGLAVLGTFRNEDVKEN